MLSKWLARFNASSTRPQDAHDVSLATAVLLHEVAMADTTEATLEADQVLREISHAFDLTPEEAAALKQRSAIEASRAVSLHGVVEALNATLDFDGKRALMARLWRVAFADGRLDPHEEALIRKLADLLFIPHAVFVQERLRVEAQVSGSAAA